MKEFKLKNTPADNVEVEGNETVKLPNDLTFQFNGPDHSNGGIDTYLPDSSKIFSKRIKLSKEVVSEILGKDSKKMSPAELSKKFDTTKYFEIMNSPLYDEKSKKTAQIMFEKNKASQETIFAAQEMTKTKQPLQKEMFKLGGMKYPNGGFTNVKGFTNVPITDSLGFSTMDPDPNKTGAYANLNNQTYQLSGKDETGVPFDLLTHPFITQGIYKNYEYDGKNDSVIRDYQKKMMGLDDSGKSLGDDTSKTRQKTYLDFYFNSGMQPWKHSRPLYGEIDGKKTILTKDNYEKASNVDYSPIVDGDTDYQQIMSYISPLGKPNKPGVVNPLETPMKPVVSNEHMSIPEVSTSGPGVLDKTKGHDIQDVVNGSQQAYLLSQLLNLKKKNPYYTHAPLDIAYTRFEPTNTKAQERGFNQAKESIMNSGLPEQVKQAQLAQLYGKMQDSIGQNTIQNVQGDLANDNNNIQLFNQVNNANNQDRVRANYQYVQEDDRAQFMKEAQAEEIKKNMFNMWRQSAMNKSDISLVNELSSRYNFDPKLVKAVYEQGKGTKPDYSVLDAVLAMQNFYKTKDTKE